jgi:hypothetical protein
MLTDRSLHEKRHPIPQSVVPCFETLMGVKTIHEATRKVISCPFSVISWIVIAQGKKTRNQTGALPPNPFYGQGTIFQYPSSLRLGIKFQL